VNVKVEVRMVFMTALILFLREFDDFAEQGLKRFEPASEDCAELGEPVYIGGVVKLLFVGQVAHEGLGKAVAVLGEGVIVLAVPEVAEVNYDFVDFIHGVVSYSDRDSFFQFQALARAGTWVLFVSFDADNPREVVFVPSVCELMVVQFASRVVKPEPQPLQQQTIQPSHVVYAQPNYFGNALTQHSLLFLFVCR